MTSSFDRSFDRSSEASTPHKSGPATAKTPHKSGSATAKIETIQGRKARKAQEARDELPELPEMRLGSTDLPGSEEAPMATPSSTRPFKVLSASEQVLSTSMFSSNPMAGYPKPASAPQVRADAGAEARRLRAERRSADKPPDESTGKPAPLAKPVLQRSNTINSVMSLGDELPSWLQPEASIPEGEHDFGVPAPVPEEASKSASSSPPRPAPPRRSTTDGNLGKTSTTRFLSNQSTEQPSTAKSTGTGSVPRDDDSMFASFESRDTSTPRKLREPRKPSTGRRKRRDETNSEATDSLPRDDDSMFGSFEQAVVPSKSSRSGSSSHRAGRSSSPHSPKGTSKKGTKPGSGRHTPESAPNKPGLRRSATVPAEGSSSEFHREIASTLSLSPLAASTMEKYAAEKEKDDIMNASFDTYNDTMNDSFDSMNASASSGPGSSSNRRFSIGRSLKNLMGKKPGSVASGMTKDSPGVIIFDWDDTLMPTTFVKQVVVPSLPLQDQERALTEQSPFYSRFVTHAAIVEELLRAASKVAHVAIVTLATNWWVETAAERYLPGLDFLALLRELDVVVYPADRQTPMVKAYALSGRDPSKVAKKAAMFKCLKSIYSGSTVMWNVLSVGDSAVEREALKECIASLAKKNSKAICKTVKIREYLGLPDLTKELQTLTPTLCQLVSTEEDFDRTVDNLKPGALGRLLRI